MKDNLIKLFMWGYQPHFRAQCEFRMNNVMSELGVSQAGSECLLVGARIPEKQNPNGVCVEPEDGKWTVGLFDGLLDQIEMEVKQHPSQKMFYTEEPSMRDKPENIRRDSVRKAVTQIKRYGGRLGHRDSRIGEKSWRFRSSSDRGTVRGSDGRN